MTLLGGLGGLGAGVGPAHAQASDPDAAGLARGGAVVAAPTAGAAFVYNPALAPPGLRGLRVVTDLRLDTRQVTARHRRVDAVRTSRSPVEPRVRPLVAVQGALGVPGLTGAAWYRLRIDERAWFPGQDPENPLRAGRYDWHRYTALRYRFTEHGCGLALAWRPRPWIALGAAVAGRTVRLDHERMLWTGTAAELDPALQSTAHDLPFRVTLRAPWVWEGRFGLLLRPVAPLRIGLAFALPGVARLSGKATLPDERTGGVDPLSSEANATLRLRLPWTLRAAVGVDLWRLSVDAQLSLRDAVRPRTPAIDTAGLIVSRVGETELRGITAVPLGLRFARRWELGLGVQARIARWLTLSAGYRYTESELDPAWRTATRISPDRHLLTVGVGVRRGPVRLDVAYGRAWAISHGAPGAAPLAAPLDPEARAPTGADRLTRNGDLVSASLTLALDYLP
jgi:hypothetical protein